MPHECTNCGHVFADGSKEMLSGCPDCGGNKFQFRPAEATSSGSDGASQPADDPSGPESGDPSPESGSSPSTEATREWPDHGADETGTDRTDAVGPTDTADTADAPDAESSIEDPAQADARTDVVSPDEIAAASPEETERSETASAAESSRTDTDAGPPSSDTDGRVIEPSSDERPDLEDLREELNEQFESIRIVAPGEYELNLMELYDRTEYIISLQEDGRYVIEVPDTWDTTPDPDET